MPRKILYDPRGTPSKVTEEDVGAEKWRKIFNPGIVSPLIPYSAWILKASDKSGVKIVAGPFECMKGSKEAPPEAQFKLDELGEESHLMYSSTTDSKHNLLKELKQKGLVEAKGKKKTSLFSAIFKRGV